MKMRAVFFNAFKQVAKYGLLITALNSKQALECCTLTAAINPKHKKTHLGKTRDNRPGDIQSVVAFPGKKGDHPFIALVSQEKEYERYIVRGGSNGELSVVNAFAGVLDRSYAHPDDGKHPGHPAFKAVPDDGEPFMRHVLHSYLTVDHVYRNLSSLVKEYDYPAQYLLTDRKNILLIEIAPGQQVRATLFDKGYCSHTNVYEHPDFKEWCNLNNTVSPESRRLRIAELMASKPHHTEEDLWSFMKDQHAGPHNSIFRAGEGGGRTLSSILIVSPHDEGKPVVLQVEFYPDCKHEGAPRFEFDIQKYLADLTSEKVLISEKECKTALDDFSPTA